MPKRNRFARVYFKYITVVILAVMVVLGVVLFAQTRGTSPDETDPEETRAVSTEDSSASDESTQETSSEEPTEPTIAPIDLMKVTELMALYYQAKVDDNLEQLNRLVDSDRDYTSEDASSSAQFVDRYDDFMTYIMSGADLHSFIVYVMYNIYFRGISTGAAALNHFYVIRNEDELVIYDRPLSAAQQASLIETENSETVQKLKTQVDEELAQACESNPDLKYLMAMLNHTTVDDTSSAQ